MAARSDANDNNDAMCGKCDINVTSNDHALNCETCNKWFHIKCESYPVSVYNFMRKEQGKQLRWNCSKCNPGVTSFMKQMSTAQNNISENQTRILEIIRDMKKDVDKNKEKLVSHEDRLGHLEAYNVKNTEQINKNTEQNSGLLERLGNLEATVASLKEEVANAKTQSNVPKPNNTASSSGDVFTEMHERKRRENNIVIYGAPEMRGNNVPIPNKVEHDIQYACELMQACEVTLPKENIFKVSRMGKSNPTKFRPMLIKLKFKDTTTKGELFKNIKKLL